tara:strand:- start:4421 stop:5395 length:975 start_codon:yes stop_codon:yes gene_type:complete
MEKETKHTETDRVERFIEVINWSGVNKSEFGRQIGVLSPRSITAIATDRKNPSSKMIQKVVDRWPQINYDWLLTGHGEMINKEVPLKPITEASIKEQAHDYLDLRSVGKKLEEQDYSLNKVADKMYEVLKVVKDLREEVDEKLNFTVKFAKQSLEALVSNQEMFVNDFKRNFKKAVEGTQDEFFKSLFKQREKVIETISYQMETKGKDLLTLYSEEAAANAKSREEDIKNHFKIIASTKEHAEKSAKNFKISIDVQENKIDDMQKKLEESVKHVEKERRIMTNFIQETFEPFVQKELLSRQELTNIVENKAASVVKEEFKKLKS